MVARAGTTLVTSKSNTACSSGRWYGHLSTMAWRFLHQREKKKRQERKKRKREKEKRKKERTKERKNKRKRKERIKEKDKSKRNKEYNNRSLRELIKEKERHISLHSIYLTTFDISHYVILVNVAVYFGDSYILGCCIIRYDDLP